tara:strand:+ start:1276 stop:1599 length:324 start_codon:yes stop_codon:yes gene_type:complete
MLKLLILFITIIIIIEIYSLQINYKYNNKILQSKEKPNYIVLHMSESDIEIKDYIGHFCLMNNYGFFIENGGWNYIDHKIYYQFKSPVDIKLININNDLIYYKDVIN